MVVASKGFSSFIDFKDKPPKRCLDIGTGLGLWVLSSARTWPESTFVGLDMVNIQPPLQVLESEMADRVEWVHTNILRNKLPFDDDEFDHVHMQCVALGIPENKWHDVFEEIRRVMKPGATIELLEEDAIFPILPRWYTNPLRAHARGPSTIYPGAVQQPPSYPSSFVTSELAHEHELLETLYHDVWSNRFINPTPSSCIPGYFGAFFDRVLAPPVLNFFTPPLAPFAPLPGVIKGGGSTHTLLRPSSSNGSSDFSRESVSSLLTPLNTENMPDPSLTHSPTSTQPTSAGSVKSSLSPTPSLTSLHQEQRTNATTPNTEHSNGSTTNGRAPPVRRDSGAASVQSTTDSHDSNGSTGAKVGRRPSVLLSSAAESTSLGGAHAVSLIPTDSLEDQEEQSRFMHLYRAVTFVLSTKEAMWEELAARVAARDPELRRFGWGEEDYTPHASRARFETAVDQYQSDMRGRISLWHSLVKNGWELPPRDPLGKTEIVEEMRLREDILASHRLAVEDTNEPDVPCRKVRLIVGIKDSNS
ncbi:hypothetical protein TRAPUB_6732 [Trametes pubescens]|uniref:Methyltransferase domain-containing protein n=1 Tax=Trametes pubescens TaxID=154538 RepID=A0A1M2V586_TRAPU|nr:hypothetical protein TRAPUB_6732 [Trametes pubescens]